MRISLQTVFARSPLLILGLTLFTLIWISVYLYIQLYKPLIQTEAIIIIRSETALLTIDFQAYERLKKLQEVRFNLKPLEIPASLNPFLPRSAEISKSTTTP